MSRVSSRLRLTGRGGDANNGVMSRPWVLVTGASGFVGGHLVRRLLEDGERVRAFVRAGANVGRFRGLPPDRFELAYGDVTIGHTVYRALAGCDRAYHLATVFRWWDPRPERILAPAIDGTRAVLEAARQRGLSRVVVTSSVAALGTAPGPEPIQETYRDAGPEPELYVLAKRRALEVTEEFAAAGLPVVIVLPSAIAGPEDTRPTPVGAAILRYLQAKVRVPAIAGGISVTDVEDVVAGHVQAMRRGVVGRRYILGGENVTYAGLLEALSELTGLPPPRRPVSPALLMTAAALLELGARVTGLEPPLTRRMVSSRVGRYSWVDSGRAERELGYQHRPLVETLRRAVTWFVANGRVADPLGRRLRYELEAR